jgi:hypothetical protein
MDMDGEQRLGCGDKWREGVASSKSEPPVRGLIAFEIDT